MSAKKNPLSDKAYLMYKQGMKLVDIAEQLGCSSATIRTWKNRYKWDSGGNATFQKQCETKCNVSEREISWVNIEHEYVTDIRKKPCTLEELATKHNIAIGTIEKYSMQHEWSEKRKSYKESIQQKALEKGRAFRYNEAHPKPRVPHNGPQGFLSPGAFLSPAGRHV